METAAPTTEELIWNQTSANTTMFPSVYNNPCHAVIIASFTIIIGVLGIIGNCLVFLAVVLSKKLQNATNAFVVSLSISDFISSLTLPLQGVGVLSETGWPLAKELCDLLGAVIILTNSASILTLTAIGINRYILITKSKSLYHRIYTHRGIAAILAFLWLLPLLVLVIPQLIPAAGGLVFDPIFRSCLWDLQHPLVLVFQTIGSVIFIICTITIAFCYIAIYVFIRRHVTRTEVTLRSSSNDALHVDNSDGKPAASPGPSVKQINITKNLAIVVVVFFICVLPYSLNLYVPAYYIHTAYLAVLLVLPTCLNPLIYAAKHPNFKVVFKCMFTCKIKDIPQPSQCLKAVLRLADVSHISGQASTSV